MVSCPHPRTLPPPLPQGLGWISTLSGVPVYTGDAYLPSGGYTNCAAYIANVNARLTTTTTTTPTTNSGISSVVSKCCDGSLCNTQCE